MPNDERAAKENDSSLPISGLPKSALQALYHTVTGKTENLYKLTTRSVVVRASDFEQLYLRLEQQLAIYDVVVGPTTTVVVKQADHRVFTYSSWERYQNIQISSHEITSEISLKLEFVIQIPNTQAPQRCSVNISIDSGLPVIANQDDQPEFPFIRLMYFGYRFPTVITSIDFVDFLVAKSFANVIEEWEQTLTAVTRPKWARYFVRNSDLARSVLAQSGKLGLALYISSYTWFRGFDINRAPDFLYATSIALVIWCIVSVIVTYATKSLNGAIAKSILPSVILLTTKDTEVYAKVERDAQNSWKALTRAWLSGLVAVALNVLASYVYAFLQTSGAR